MNNKKLFKGALVLFASILMAVSCQSNSNPDDGNGNGSGNGNGGGNSTDSDKVTAITDEQIKTALVTALGANIDADNPGGNGKQFATSGATYANGKLSITSANGAGEGQLSSAPSKQHTAANIKKQKDQLTSKLSEIGITLGDIDSITEITAGGSSGAKGTFVMPITVKKGYSLPTGTESNITIELTPTGQTWK